MKFGEVVGQISQPIGRKGAGHHEFPQDFGLGDLGAVQDLGQGRGKQGHPPIGQVQ